MSCQYVVENWKQLQPSDVVRFICDKYPNTATCASQLSVVKSALRTLPNPPSTEYLKCLQLEQAKYKELRSNYQQKRTKEGMDVLEIKDAGVILRRAQKWVDEAGDPGVSAMETLIGLLIVTGFRQIEVLKTIGVSPKTMETYGPNQHFYVCASGFAKRGFNMSKSNPVPCRDKPVLVKIKSFFKALAVVRDEFVLNSENNTEIHNKYSKKIQRRITSLFPGRKFTSTIFRRFYAAAAIHYFPYSAHGKFSTITGVSQYLGHIQTDDAAISYNSIDLQNLPETLI